MSGRSPAAGASPRAPTAQVGSQIVVGTLVIGATIGGAEYARWALLLVVALVCMIAGAELGTDFSEGGLTGSPLIYLAAVVAFPISAYLWREQGLSAAAAAVIFLAALRFVASRPERGALVSIAVLVLSALYIGFGSGYLILLRRQPNGARLVAGLVVISFVYHAFRWVGDQLIGKRSMASHLPNTSTLPGLALGVICALAATPGFVAFLHRPVHALVVAQIGLPICAGLTLGTFAWALIRPETLPVERSMVPRQVLYVVQGAVLAAPALYYAARLALR